METFYLEPVTEDMIIEKLSREAGEEILGYERISSLTRKHPYEIKNEQDAKYLEDAKKIIADVGDFVRDCLPGFPSQQRANFDYVRAHQVEFLDRYELWLKVRAETPKGQKELCLCFHLPSFVSIPKVVYRVKGGYVYLYNHLECRVSFVIGNPGNPKTQDYFIDDAMEEFWHLALYPYLIERLNRNVQSGTIQPSDPNVSKILVVEGELLSKAFALASFDEFKQKKGYDVPKREPKGKEKVILDKIERVGIRKALRDARNLELSDTYSLYSVCF
jgi:hypothetical protein